MVNLYLSEADWFKSNHDKSTDAPIVAFKTDMFGLIRQAHGLRIFASFSLWVFRLMRLLIADDDRGGANTLAILLRREGFQVEVAYDGQKAVETALAFDPDVLILDLQMPTLDGFQTIRRLRAMPQFVDRRFVALTSYSAQTHLDEASKAQFDDYLIKPCELDVLKKILSEAATTAGA